MAWSEKMRRHKRDGSPYKDRERAGVHHRAVRKRLITPKEFQQLLPEKKSISPAWVAVSVGGASLAIVAVWNILT